MKIALITNSFHPQVGGITYTLYNIYKSFINSEHEIYVFNPCLDGQNLYRTIKNRNYHLKEIPSLLKNKKLIYYIVYSFFNILKDKNLPFSNRIFLILLFLNKPIFLLDTIENLNRTIPILKKKSFDIILSGNLYRSLPSSYILSRIFNKKIIAIAYGRDFVLRYSFFLRSIMMRNLDKIIVISNPIKTLLSKMHYIDEEKMVVIPVGIDENDLRLNKGKKETRRELNIQEDVFVILSVGRHVKRKRFDLVIKAVKRMTESASIKLKYFLIGDGVETANLKKLTKELNLEENVIFLGRISKLLRNQYYSASDIFIMPSELTKKDVEGFGIVFLEANYFNLPVITTNQGGMSDAVIHNKTGFFINPNNIDELIDKISLLLTNKSRYIEMGNFGHKRVIDEFRWSIISKKYFKEINKILEIE